VHEVRRKSEGNVEGWSLAGCGGEESLQGAKIAETQGNTNGFTEKTIKEGKSCRAAKTGGGTRTAVPKKGRTPSIAFRHSWMGNRKHSPMHRKKDPSQFWTKRWRKEKRKP